MKLNKPMTYFDFMSLNYGGFCTLNATLTVTEQCNLNCSYCYETKKTKRKMTKETAKKAIDLLFKEHGNSSYISEDNKAIVLEFIGGEPLLEIELIDYAVDYFKHKAIELNHIWSKNFKIALTTNGTLYFDDKVQRFINKNRDKLSLTVTLDGNKKLHDSCRVFHDGTGSYDLAEKAVLDQLKHDNYVETKLTLSPYNIEHLSSAFENLHKLGLKIINCNCVYEEGWEKQHGEVLYKELKKVADYILNNELYKTHSFSIFDDYIGKALAPTENENFCGGTGKMLAFDVEGNVYPCLRYIPFSINNEREPMVIGTLKGIGKTEKEKSCASCLKEITRESQSSKECFECPIASGCGWCSAYNYDLYGTANKRATFICITHKARILANSYFFNKLYRKEGIEERYSLNVPLNWGLEVISLEEYNYLKYLSQ